MKTKTEKIALVIAIILVLLYGTLIFIGTKFLVKNIHITKQPISMEQFEEIMEKKNFKIYNVTQQFKDADVKVKEGCVAKKDNCQIEFYTFNTEDDADRFFRINKEKFEENKASNKIQLTGQNYSSYGITANGKYKFVIRVEKSVMYLNVDDDLKDQVKLVVKDLGY